MTGMLYLGHLVVIVNVFMCACVFVFVWKKESASPPNGTGKSL